MNRRRIRKIFIALAMLGAVAAGAAPAYAFPTCHAYCGW